jgi:hypothetical protein
MNNTNYELGPLCGSTDNETLDRARSGLNQYFSLARNANLTQWEQGREGFLCTNVAVQAYIMLLGSLIKYWEANTAADSREMNIEEVIYGIEEYMAPILTFVEQADDESMKTAFRVPFGSGGPPEYYFRLCHWVKTKYPDFEPEGLSNWEEEQSEEKIQTADRKIRDIVVEMQKFIFTVFRTIHGEEKDAYWHTGVPDRSIKSKAYDRSLEDETDERLPLETYLDVIDLKKIVEHKQNWPVFKSAFNIPEPGEKGYAKNLKWMERVNELRRIPAHPSERRHYKVEDFDYIDYIYEEFFRRLKEAERNPTLVVSGSSGDGDA